MKPRSDTTEPTQPTGTSPYSSDLARRWTEVLRAVPGISAAAATLEDRPAETSLLPVSRLLPHDDRQSRRSEPLQGTPAAARPALIDGGQLEIAADSPRTLSDALAHAANAIQSGLVYIDKSGENDHFVSYNQLLEDAERVLSGLRHRGLQPGDKVVFQFDMAEDFLAAFWGCTLGGFIPVPATVAPTYRELSAAVDRVRMAWEILDKPLILAGDRLAEEIRSAPGLAGIEGHQVASIGDTRHSERDTRWHEPSSDDPALFLLTSGSTGIPKVVVQTHSNLLSSAAAATLVHPFKGTSTFLNWFPLDHVAGVVMFHFQPLWLGALQIHGPMEAVLRQPAVWLEWIERYKATVTWAPNFAYGQVNEMVALHPDKSWDLSSMRFILNGGEAIVSRTVRRFMSLLAPFGLGGDSMYPGWGMSETSGGIIFSRSFRLETTADDDPFVSLGHPYPGTALRIVDESGEVVPESAIGRLQVRGVSVLHGYHRNPEANAEAFTDDGWFDTGDEGLLDANGLTLTGRAKETIIINGVNYPGHQIESVVEGCNGVERSNTAACAVRRPGGDTDELAIFCTLTAGNGDAASIIREIRDHVVQNVGLHPAYVMPLPAAEIPKTAIGKIQRPKLVQRFQAGDFDDLLAEFDPQAARGAEIPDWFYRKVWPVDSEPLGGADEPLNRTLIFSSDAGLVEGLAGLLSDSGGDLIWVQAGIGFERHQPGRWTVDPTSGADLDRLLAEVVAEGGPVDHVVHAWTYGNAAPAISDIDQLRAAQRLGTYSLGSLIGALERNQRPASRLTVVTARASDVETDEEIDYPAAAISGLLKSIALESPWLQCSQCDLEGDRPESDARDLLSELRRATGEAEVAYRRGQRRVARLERLAMLEEPMRPLPIQEGGIYLIPGALGGMGVHLARCLADRYGIKIVALGRTPLPAADDWPRHLREDDATAARIRSYQAIQAATSDLIYEAVDVTDSEGLRRVREQAEERWQTPISGIIHLAGVNRERHWEDSHRHFAGTEDPAEVEQMFQAKVYGTWALADLISDLPDALFVCISSVLGEFGAPGHSAYSAASSFMSGFAAHRRAQGRLQSWCLSWSMWDEVGMSAGSPQIVRDATVGRGFHLISPEAGETSFLAGLARQRHDIIIGLEGTHPQVRARLANDAVPQHWVGYFVAPEPVAPKILERLEIHGVDGPLDGCVFRQVDELAYTPTGEVDFGRLGELAAGGGGAEDDDGDETAAAMTELWGQVLNMAHVGRSDRFFEIGGDSLKATQLLQRISDTFGVDVSLRDFFDDPTVSGLVRSVKEEALSDGVDLPVSGS